MRPERRLIRANPKAGTPLMQQVPAVGLDLPLKVLVLEGDQGKTWMLYNDPGYILQRYGLDRGGAERLLRRSRCLRSRPACRERRSPRTCASGARRFPPPPPSALSAARLPAGGCSSTRLRLRRCPETHSRHTLAHGSAQTAYLCRPDAVIHPDEQDVIRRTVRTAGERHEQPER